MKQLKLHSSISVSANQGGIYIQWGDYINGQYHTLAKVDIDPTPGSDSIPPKEVEFACLKLAGVINAFFAEERKQTADKASCPKVLLDGSDLERFVAQGLLKLENQQ